MNRNFWILSILCFFSAVTSAEGLPYGYVREIHFRANSGNYVDRMFSYQLNIRPSTIPNHAQLARKFLDWAEKRLREELPYLEEQGCTPELRKKFWDILEEELRHYRGLSVQTVCRLSGVSQNIIS